MQVSHESLFNDHIIRNNKEFQRIILINNTKNWETDSLNYLVNFSNVIPIIPGNQIYKLNAAQLQPAVSFFIYQL